MALMKVIELLAESPKSWEDAAQQAVNEASKSVHGIRSVYIKELEAKVDNNRITSYRLNVKVTFEVDTERPAQKTAARRTSARR